MLILLPPSETKAFPAEGAPLDLASLSFPELSETRRSILTDVVRLCTDSPEQALDLLKLSPRQGDEVVSNAGLLSAATAPALQVYTGVLFDALDAPTLPEPAREVLAVGSALFGLVAGSDSIPHYRLSANSKVPTADAALPTMRARWGRTISDVIGGLDAGLIVDLRSGGYRNLGKPPSGVPTLEVRVVTEDGKVVSHFNKHYKGQLARALALSGEHPADAAELVDLVRVVGFAAEVTTSEQVQLTVS